MHKAHSIVWLQLCKKWRGTCLSASMELLPMDRDNILAHLVSWLVVMANSDAKFHLRYAIKMFCCLREQTSCKCNNKHFTAYRFSITTLYSYSLQRSRNLSLVTMIPCVWTARSSILDTTIQCRDMLLVQKKNPVPVDATSKLKEVHFCVTHAALKPQVIHRLSSLAAAINSSSWSSQITGILPGKTVCKNVVLPNLKVHLQYRMILPKVTWWPWFM